uniref:Uncharacterized protein n=1 Tax=Arundo donax TaxID=35708 RepID=A0A0A9HXX7_ARUDO
MIFRAVYACCDEPTVHASRATTSDLKLRALGHTTRSGSFCRTPCARVSLPGPISSTRLVVSMQSGRPWMRYIVPCRQRLGDQEPTSHSLHYSSPSSGIRPEQKVPFPTEPQPVLHHPARPQLHRC